MYAKVFSQIHDSSISRDYRVMDLFMHLLVLADRLGVVDMTYEAIARRTNRPVELVIAGIGELTKADPESRSKKMEGARLALIDSDRPWGWRIVNYERYRNLRDEESRRAYMRDLMREKRKKKPENVNSLLAPVSKTANKNSQVPGNENVLAKTANIVNDVNVSREVRESPRKSTALAPVSTLLATPANSKTEVTEKEELTKAPVSTLLAGVSSCYHPLAHAEADKNTLSKEGKDIVQHADAKRVLGKLSEEVFGSPLYPSQWPSDMEHWLDDVLPMKWKDLELVDWFYRLPRNHPIFNVTRRKQSMRALIQSLLSEVQKVHSALAALEVLSQKNGAAEEPPEEDDDGWGEGYREAAYEELGSSAILPARFEDLEGDLQERVMDRRKKMRLVAYGS